MTVAGKFNIDEYWPGHTRWLKGAGLGPFKQHAGNGHAAPPPLWATPAVRNSRPMLVHLASEFDGHRPPDREFLVPHLIPSGNVTALYGNGGTGKSLIALQLAVAAVAGGKWLGQHVNGGDVLFLSAEDDLDEIHRRLVDIAIVEGLSLAELAGLKIVSLAGEDALLAITEGRGGELQPTARMTELTALVEDHQPALVVLDTLADLFAGEENDRAHARQFISMLRGIALHQRTTILLPCHPSLSGMASGAGTSGSTAWSNSVRSRLYLDKPKGDDGSDLDADTRVLRVAKANYASTDFELKVRWQNGVFVAEPGQGSDYLTRRGAQSHADEIFLKLVIAYDVEGRKVGAAVAGNYAPTVFASDPRAEGISMASFRDAMNRLLAARRVKVETFGPPSRPERRIVAVQPEAET